MIESIFRDKVNSHVKIDDIVGYDDSNFVFQRVDNTTTYTVPNGKVLLIHSLFYTAMQATERYLKLNSTNILVWDNASGVDIYIADRNRMVYNGSETRILYGAGGSTMDDVISPSGNTFVYVDAPFLLFPIASGSVLSGSATEDTYFFGTLREAR